MKPLEITTTLDRDRVVFDGDRRLRSALSALERKLATTPAVAGLPAPLPPMAPPPGGRAELLKTAFRLSRGLAPPVWRALDQCTEFLGITRPIEVYVMAAAEANAFTMTPERGRLLIGITSSCIERLEPAELVSVLGHELGHVLLGHHELNGLFAQESDERLTPADAMRLYAWRRYAELSADRVGLLCCDDFDACITAEFKLVSGLSEARHLGDPREIARQFARLTHEELEQSDGDWLATHPYAPLRIRALELFWRSTTYAALRGRSGGELGERALEAEVEAVMGLMNPSCLDEKAAGRDEVRELLVLAGLVVASADERVDDAESRALARLTGARGLTVTLPPALRDSREARDARLGELAARLSVHLSLLRRRKVVEDLCAIARADGQIAPTEVAILQTLAILLGVDPLEVDAALARADAPLD